MPKIVMMMIWERELNSRRKMEEFLGCLRLLAKPNNEKSKKKLTAKGKRW